MRQAAVHNKDVKVDLLVKDLGIRLAKILIINEKDCMRIKPKSWLDKKGWHEIHDILRAQGLIGSPMVRIAVGKG